MPYLIDGHNLIPKVPGLSLETLDDEQQLIQLLQEYCRRQRKQAEVFFDNAPPDGVRARKFGLVVAKFVRQGSTADDAIRSRLVRLGREARNWTVVSSDQAVQASARAARAQTLSSETFARTLLQILEEGGAERGKRTDVSLSEDEVDDWLRLFGDENQGR
ncbi:MAG: NYN domain-containing protein [Anaerolineales bacterium]|nr:NYN domain-containing protein [Anaerolineales bacterium]